MLSSARRPGTPSAGRQRRCSRCSTRRGVAISHRARASFGSTLDDSIDRAIDELLGSPRSERVIERILESEQLWTLVDRIANSAEVLDAIASTSAGLAGEVADQARRRTVVADDVAERIARRLLRRPPREQGTPMDDPGVAEPLVPQR